MKILTATDQFIVEQQGGYKAFISMLVATRWKRLIDWKRLPIEGEVEAEIVTGNWRVKCPYCSGAIVAEPNEPYFCPDCLNQANGFRALRVIFPDNREQIETLLLLRPNPTTRNWLAGEAVSELARENLEHGIGGFKI